MGEAISLVNNFKVEKVIFNCGPYNNLEKELIKVLDKKKIPYYSCIRELNIELLRILAMLCIVLFHHFGNKTPNSFISLPSGFTENSYFYV